MIGTASTSVLSVGFIWADQDLLAFVVVGGVLFSLAQAVVFTGLPNAAVEAVPAAGFGEASGIYTTVRLIFLACGNTVAASILSAGTDPTTSVVSGTGFTIAYLVMAVGAVVGLGLALLLRREESRSDPVEEATGPTAGRRLRTVGRPTVGPPRTARRLATKDR